MLVQSEEAGWEKIMHGTLCHKAALTLHQDPVSSEKEAHLPGSARGIWPREEDTEGNSVVGCTLSPQSSFPFVRWDHDCQS